MRIAVLALEGVFDTGLATVLDTFATANELARSNPPADLSADLPGNAPAGAQPGAPISLSCPSLAPVPFEVSVVGLPYAPPKPVHSGLGLQVPVCDPGARPPPDWVIVPALSAKVPQALEAALHGEAVRHARAALRTWAANGTRLAAACTGTFVLAESGLLDAHEATTTWWLTPLFRQRYPKVKLDAHRIVVASGALLTAGAALSHIDLALWLIRQRSPALAALVARYLVFDTRPSQSAYVIADHLVHADPVVQQFDSWIRERLGRPITLDAAAAALAISTRTLSRRLHRVLGKTPLAYVQDLRIEQAAHLLKTTRLSVDRIAEQVGYADAVSLRRLLRKRLGKGIRQLRMP